MQRPVILYKVLAIFPSHLSPDTKTETRRAEGGGGRHSGTLATLASLKLAHKDPLMGGKTGPSRCLLGSTVKRAGFFLSNLTAFWEWPALSLPLGVVGVSSGSQSMGCGLSRRTPICALYFWGRCPLNLNSGHFAWMWVLNGSCEQPL